MFRNKKHNRIKKAVAIAIVLLPLALLAQTEAAKPAQDTSSGNNELLWYSLYSIMGLLLLVIMVLGNVLINTVKLTIEKNKIKTAAMIMLLFVSSALFSQETQATAPATVSSLVTNWNMIMALCVLGTELFVIVVLLLRIRRMLNELVPQKEKHAFKFRFPKLLDNLNASVAVEHEKDILLDHDYDGIKELNNDLPPWWKYSFIISIFWAIGYFSYYHVLGGPSSHDEYEASMRQAAIQQEEYARANAGKVDENNIVIANAAGIAEGKDIFMTNCSPCHGKDGQGIVGPNLTDDYWLHGGNIKDIFKSIKLGWPAKGMKSWATDLSPLQIKNVASYIKSIHGTNPANAKAPQGDLYNEGGVVKTDSTNAVAAKDTAQAKGI